MRVTECLRALWAEVICELNEMRKKWWDQILEDVNPSRVVLSNY